jgi:hypothetical protein
MVQEVGALFEVGMVLTVAKELPFWHVAAAGWLQS